MTIRQRVLIVEEDREIYSSISMLLSDNGYEVLYAYTGEEALSLIGSHCPDIILLDLVLPDMAGMEVLDSVREWSLVPMIVLARKKEEQDIVLALDHGADDYVALPYGEQELLARMRAAIRHTRTGSADLELANKGRITVGRMIIDYDKYRVYMDGEDVNLTQNEFRMVAMLGRYSGKVLTYEQMLRELWGPNAGNDNQVLRVNMVNIRRKMEKPGKPRYIFTENGIGYRMLSREEAEE